MLSKSKEIVWRFPLGLFLLSFSSSNFCAEKTNFFHRETFDSLSLSLSFAHCVKKFFLVQKLNLDFQSLKYLKVTQKSHKNFFFKSSCAWKLIKTWFFWRLAKLNFLKKLFFWCSVFFSLLLLILHMHRTQKFSRKYESYLSHFWIEKWYERSEISILIDENLFSWKILTFLPKSKQISIKLKTYFILIKTYFILIKTYFTVVKTYFTLVKTDFILFKTDFTVVKIGFTTVKIKHIPL